MFIVHNNLDHIPLNFYNKYEEYKNKKYEAPKKKKNTSSKYIGVCLSKNRNKWRCNVSINFKQKNLGYFNDEIDGLMNECKIITEYCDDINVLRGIGKLILMCRWAKKLGYSIVFQGL